ncbi:MAG: serine/threonine-protein kinase [Myxococcota bacterium]
MRHQSDYSSADSVDYVELRGGRYRVIEPIGQGGMAIVYRAVDTQLNVDRAIKVLQQPEDDLHRRRFLNEARAMARLDHPNIVQVFDVGEEDEVLYMVMELLTGGSMDQILKHEGPIDPVTAERWSAQLLDALAAAHDAGIVHRDIKPHNVLITADGDPKLSDFGIARFEDLDLTRTGTAVGSPAYMAPEQHLDASTVDARADIFSMGSLMYAAFTGSRPYGLHQESLNGSRLQSVPEHIRPIIWQATRYRSEDRFSSAQDMLHALTAPPPDATPAPPNDTARKGIAILFGALSATIMVGVVTLLVNPQPRPAPVVQTITRRPTRMPAIVIRSTPPQTSSTETSSTETSSTGTSSRQAKDLGQPSESVPLEVAPPLAESLNETKPAETVQAYINSVPPARLTIDGRAMGRTGWQGALTEGRHRVVMLREDGTVHRRTLIVGADEIRYCWDFRSEAPCRRR